MLAQALKPQTEVREFVVNRVLGQGSYGITYLARDSKRNRRVAMKEYFPQTFATRDEDGTTVNPSQPTGDEAEDFDSGLQKFLEEARTLAGFNDRHIIKILDSFEHHGTAYVVMEYEDGSTLSRHLVSHGEPIHERDLLEIFIALLEGLRTVHAKWFLHRDIKPENIYLRKSGDPLLIDFGTARHAVSAKRGGMTEYLTPGYAPPEQYDRKGDHGPWTDVYALGATMYYCVTRIVPCDGRDRLLAIKNSGSDPVMPAVRAAPGLYRRELLELIDWMMAPDHRDRAHSVDDVLLRMRQLRLKLDESPARIESLAETRKIGALKTAEPKPSQPVAAAQPPPAEPTLGQPIGAIERMPAEPSPADAPVAAPTELFAGEPIIRRGARPTRSGTRNRTDRSSRHGLVIGAVLAVAGLVGGGWWYLQPPADDRFAEAPRRLPAQDEPQPAVPAAIAEDPGLALPSGELKQDEIDARFSGEQYVIAGRLQECEAHVAARRLTTGTGGNALDCYNAILAQYPDNDGARAGLTGIEDTYLVLVRDAIGKSQVRRAESLLARARNLNPDRPEIASFQEQLTALAKAPAPAVVTAPPPATPPKSRGKTSDLMRQAAESGVAVAQYNLAIQYAQGVGVEQDDAQAAKWFGLAARQGIAEAQYNLGAMYQNGQGVSRDDVEAVRWYRQAAEQGVVAAQYNLGMLYENGQGVDFDSEQARRWYEKAAASGHPSARVALERMVR